MVKKTKRPGHLVDGAGSKRIDKIMDDFDLSFVKGYEKFEENKDSWLQAIQKRRDLFIEDSYTRQYFANMIKQMGPDILAYQADLVQTQIELSRIQEQLQFHNKALNDLQKRYIDALDEEKPEIYEQIERVEKIIANYNRSKQNYIETRNKIRKELDKKNYQKESLDLKERELTAKGGKITDIDMSVLDVE